MEGLPEGFTIRQATIEDVPIITAHRRAMFQDMRSAPDSVLDDMSEKFAPWAEAKMRAGEYLGWFAIAADGAVGAGAGLWIMDWPPHILGRSQRRGNILNVYTEPQFRRRGLARRLTQTALDWCRDHGVDTVILHASDQGRAIYENMGFQPTNEMRIAL
jgi:GNAT superfamily N-acetyltransferase